jgi:hypothetical protein
MSHFVVGVEIQSATIVEGCGMNFFIFPQCCMFIFGPNKMDGAPTFLENYPSYGNKYAS